MALLKESIQLGCVSQDYPLQKSTLREIETLELNHTIKFTKGTWHHKDIRERKGPSQGVMQKFEPQGRKPCAQRFEERTQEEILQQERCAHRETWDLAKKVFRLKNKDKATFHSPTEVWVMPAPSSKKTEYRKFVVDSGASVPLLCIKDLSSGELDTLRKSRKPQRWS